MQPLLNKVESDKILFEGMPMQKKHLIALTLATILMLFGYNIVSSYFYEKNRAALIDTDSEVVKNGNEENDSNSAQPLGEKPKAIIDNATAQIEQVQDVEQQRLEQMNSAQ
jgi:predicted membrane protein